MGLHRAIVSLSGIKQGANTRLAERVPQRHALPAVKSGFFPEQKPELVCYKGQVEYLDTESAARGFETLLCEAASRVEEPWFLLPVSSADKTEAVRRYRERVYCYELYHQIRALSAESAGAAAGAPAYQLSGEIDKAGLNAVIDGGRHKPDLVWHVPGISNHNAVVIEVKAVDKIGRAALRKDLETLTAFLSADRGYRRAILLVYGWGDGEALRERVIREAEYLELDPSLRRRIQFFWHQHALRQAVDMGPLAVDS
jgi:hypothetical protein